MKNLFLDNIKDAIKANVTMQDVCDHFGIPVKRNGIIQCPFHDDRHESCKIYPGNKGYYCFSCGSGGDCIKFVSNFLKCSTVDAMRELAPLAGVTFDSDSKISEKARQEQVRRKSEREKLDAEYSEAVKEYDKWAGIYAVLDKWKRDFAPTDMDSELDKRYIKAIRNLDYVSYQMDQAEDRLKAYKR